MTKQLIYSIIFIWTIFILSISIAKMLKFNVANDLLIYSIIYIFGLVFLIITLKQKNKLSNEFAKKTLIINELNEYKEELQQQNEELRLQSENSQKQKKQIEQVNIELNKQQKMMQQATEKMFAQSQEIIQHQAEVERNKAKFKAIYKGATDAIFLVSNNKIIDCNKATEELFESDNKCIISNTILELSAKKQANNQLSSELLEKYYTEASQNNISKIDWIFLTLKNNIFYAKVSVSSTLVNRKKTYIVIVRDVTKEREHQIALQKITEELRENQEELRQQNEELYVQSENLEKQKIIIQKEKERADKASKSKSLFLASMSHEIRTPLNGIIGMLNLLKETKIRENQKEFIDIIDVSSKSLLDIINDILDYSKIEADQLHLEQIPIDLKKIANEVIQILELKAKEKSINLNLNIENNVPFYYNADPVRIKQILINYCNNALKFTEKGSVSVNISMLEKDNQKVKLKFEVTDTGIGISKENQAKLFKEFSQVDNSISRKFGGTGLGLAISMKLAKLMNGEVGLHSIEGEGSTFWFTIIAEKINEVITSDIEINEKIAEGLKILLIEDNIINQKVATMTLKKNNHIIDVANDGIEGLKLFKENNYDIIITDIQMPNLNGYETVIEIRKFEKDNNLKPIKIVAMTANAMKGEREKCIEVGMNDYISKPFKKEELLRIL